MSHSLDLFPSEWLHTGCHCKALQNAQGQATSPSSHRHRRHDETTTPLGCRGTGGQVASEEHHIMTMALSMKIIWTWCKMKVETGFWSRDAEQTAWQSFREVVFSSGNRRVAHIPTAPDLPTSHHYIHTWLSHTVSTTAPPRNQNAWDQRLPLSHALITELHVISVADEGIKRPSSWSVCKACGHWLHSSTRPDPKG